MRFIDADKLLEKAEEVEWWNEGTGYYEHINIVHRYDVETAPTADVVPKSEVARGIFEEIEKRLGGCDIITGNYFENVIAELKKKYTERDCQKCRYFVGCECFDGKTCDQYDERKEIEEK